MVKRHIKRLAAPKSWSMLRKSNIFASRPLSNTSMALSMPLGMILRDVLGVAETMHEVKNILQHKKVLIDGIRRTDHKFGVGLMDVLSLADIGKHYRMLLNPRGKLVMHEIADSEAKLKPCKIIGKRIIPGAQLQISLHDGRNLLMPASTPYKVGDTIMLNIPEQSVQEHFKLEKGCFIFLTAGSHIGSAGVVEAVKEKLLVVASKDEKFETSTKGAFAIGKQVPKITLLRT